MPTRTSMMRLASALASLAAMAMIIAGCGGDGDSGSSDGTVVVASWGGEYQAAQREAFWRPFEKETGIKVVEDESPDNAKIKSQVDSGNPQWDIVATGSTALQKFGPDYFEPLGVTKHAEAYAQIPKDIMTDRSVGAAQYCAAIGYRTDKLSPSERPETWEDFFNPGDFPGERAMASDGGIPFDSTEAAWLAAGNSPATVRNMDMDEILGQFSKIRPSIGKWWTSGAEGAQLLASGEVAMAIIGMSSVASLAEEGVPVAISPRDMLCGWDYWYILKGAPNKEAAQRLVAYMMDPRRQAKFSELAQMGSAHPESGKYLPKEGPTVGFLPNSPGVSPAAVKDQDVDAWWAENESEWVAKFNEWRLGG